MSELHKTSRDRTRRDAFIVWPGKGKGTVIQPVEPISPIELWTPFRFIKFPPVQWITFKRPIGNEARVERNRDSLRAAGSQRRWSVKRAWTVSAFMHVNINGCTQHALLKSSWFARNEAWNECMCFFLQHSYLQLQPFLVVIILFPPKDHAIL